LREIARAFGFKSGNAASAHLKALEKKGAIKRTAFNARCISIVGHRPAGLPFLGKVG
jgi:repressor LexA